MDVSAGKQKQTVNESNRQRKGDLPGPAGPLKNRRPGHLSPLPPPLHGPDERKLNEDELLHQPYISEIDRLSLKVREERPLLIGMEEDPPSTTLYDLPMELLDAILQKSYLHWIFNTKTKQRDEEIIRSLISVDVCFNRRITRQRFKKAIWRHLKIAVKVTVINCGGKIAEIVPIQLIQQRMNNLRNIINLKSHETNKSVSQLRNKDIEILNSEQKRQTVVVWIWCRTQAALEHIQSLYESNRMREVFFDQIQSSTSMVLNIERNQFKKNVVVYQISIKINFTQRIEDQGYGSVIGVTKLRNEIFVLNDRDVIRVFEDQNQFRLRGRIKLEQIKGPIDIGSSEKLNCLYVSDRLGHCIWKITQENVDEHNAMKWLTTDHRPTTISVSIDGNLLMVNDSPPILTIYGSDAELIRSIHLPTDIKIPIHAVETSIGNFIILHLWKEKAKNLSGAGDLETKWVVSELTRDGQEVICRFIPANKEQELSMPCYISLDSDDRVFVADRLNDRVILLDSDLQWNQIICQSEKELKAKRHLPRRLCYDKENRQLIVGLRLAYRNMSKFYSSEVTVYTLSEN